jgi:hypothetical protein
VPVDRLQEVQAGQGIGDDEEARIVELDLGPVALVAGERDVAVAADGETGVAEPEATGGRIGDLADR